MEIYPRALEAALWKHAAGVEQGLSMLLKAVGAVFLSSQQVPGRPQSQRGSPALGTTEKR